MLVVTAVLGAGTVYLFIHPGDIAFGTWGGIVTTITGVYHWLNIRDSKEKDAC